MATRDSFPDRWPVGGSHLSPDERRTRTSYFLGRNRVVSSRIKAGKSVVLNQPFTAPLHRGFLALARFSSQPRFLLPLDLLVQVLCARLGGALLTMSRAIFVRFICEYDLTSFNAGDVNTGVLVGVKVPHDRLFRCARLLALGMASDDEVRLRLVFNDLQWDFLLGHSCL